jgi:ribonuclease BN (tRNA processing enzyme)
MLLTHIHWDHILGFPFFAPLFQTNCGIVVDGCRRAMEGLRRVFSSNHVDGTWPLRFEDLKARIEAHPEILNNPIEVDGAVIEAHPLHHPQGGVGFKFRENGKTLVFLTDNELLDPGWKGASFQHFVKFCSGADVLIHDCQYLHSEIETKRGWGHSDTKSTADLAFEAGVDKLILFHHDPWRKDRQVEFLVAECERFLKEKRSGICVSAAQEGSSFNL